jgi:uncharacterized cupredoxin-like copper-binding protein
MMESELPALFAAIEATLATAVIAFPFFAAATAAATTTAATVAATATAAAATTGITAATTATATAAKTAATATATATKTTGTLFTRTGFIDGELASTKLFAIQSSNRCLHGFWCVHTDKSKPAWATAFTVDRQENIGDAAELAEKVGDFLGVGFEGEIPHIHLGVHDISLISGRCLEQDVLHGRRIERKYRDAP